MHNAKLEILAKQGPSELEKPARKFGVSLLNKADTVSLIAASIITAYVDDLGVMKHVWLAAFSAFLVHNLYQRMVLPKLLNEPLLESEFKANSFAIVCTYILSNLSGPGPLTAVINVIGVSAVISIVKPFIPKYYFISLAIIVSIVFPVLFAFKAISLYLCIPASMISLGFVARAYFGFDRKNAATNFSLDADVESSNLNSELIEKYDKEKPFVSSWIKEAFKTVGALLLTLAVGLIVVYWIILSANPFWMRAKRISKYETLHRLPHDTNLRVREVSSLDDLKLYKNDLKSFPMVIKPSICTTDSRNVVKCDDYNCLRRYLRAIIKEGPRNDGKNGDKGAWVIQEYAPDVEGVVFYYKLPYMSTGYIKNIGIRQESLKGGQSDIMGRSLTARYWPEVFRKDFSPDFSSFFNDLAEKIPGYTGGRFDVMLPSNELSDPRRIRVLEMNVFFLGCIEEKAAKTIVDELKRLRTSVMQFYIGIVNIVGGYNFLNFFGIAFQVPKLVSRCFLCGNHEHIFAKP